MTCYLDTKKISNSIKTRYISHVKNGKNKILLNKHFTKQTYELKSAQHYSLVGEGKFKTQ